MLDPFLGSGTAVIAAERTGRIGRGIEIDPIYVDVAIKRWQQYTGKAATLVETGQTFEETRGSPGSAPKVMPLARKAKGTCRSCGRLRDVEFPDPQNQDDKVGQRIGMAGAAKASKHDYEVGYSPAAKATPVPARPVGKSSWPPAPTSEQESYLAKAHE